MATGNMLQGMARGAVGDVVFYRQNGQQMSRIRVRNPRNPRTYPQVYQRAIMATIMRAYTAGKEVFDHSFQGCPVGARTMAKFMSINAKILGRLCAEEIDIMPWIHWGGAVIYPKCRARLVAYSTNGPVGFDGMMISKGTYQQSFFSVTDAWEIPAVGYEPLKFGIPNSLPDETCAQFAKRCQLVADDLYTICGFYPLDMWFRDGYDDGVSHCGLQREYYFFIIRMHVKSDFVSSQASVAGSTLDNMFTFEQPIGQGVINEALRQKALGEEFTMEDFFSQYILSDDTEAWCNIIRSKVNEGLRSTTVLKNHCAWADSGIIPAYVLPAWIPYIKGEPYPNPPIPPEPAAPQLMAAYAETAGGIFDYVLAAKFDDGSIHPYECMGGGIPLTFMEGDVPVINVTPMDCQSFMMNVVQLKDLSNSIHCEIRPYQCSLDGGDLTTFKAYIDGGLYSFVSNFVQGQNREPLAIPLSEFHV